MWTSVTSGVPQGSVSGPLLFIIFVNDIDSSVQSYIKKFADDCKIYLSVKNKANVDILQSDLHNLCKWSKDWQMVFNEAKCSVIHFGHTNGKANYIMNGHGTLLETTNSERDLGVIISNNLKPSMHCAESAKRGQSHAWLYKTAI